MKTLDRYIVKNFVISALLCLLVLISLRVVTDLFVNIDEFTKKEAGERTFLMVAKDVSVYYAIQSVLYFRELGGVIVVLAASFTLAWMNHTNELTAMLASGVSLRRVLMPIVLCALGMNVLIVMDTEFVIPRVGERLARDRDEADFKDPFAVHIVPDASGNCLYSKRLDPKDGSMFNPLIVLRDDRQAYLGLVTSPRAVYDYKEKSWEFLPGKLVAAEDLADPQKVEETPITVPWVRMKMKTDGQQELTTFNTKFIPTEAGPAKIIERARAQAANKDVNWSAATAIGKVSVRDDRRRLTIRARQAELAHEKGADGSDKVLVKVLRGVRFECGLDPERPAVVITADEAVYGTGPGGKRGWVLKGGRLLCPSDLDPGVLALRQSRSWLQQSSTPQVTRMLRLERIPDRKGAVLLRQTRFADFFNNILMLLLVAPFVLSRERNIKASAMQAVGIGAGFFVFVYFTRSIAMQPVVAAWLPILLFGPVAALQLDSIKT